MHFGIEQKPGVLVVQQSIRDFCFKTTKPNCDLPMSHFSADRILPYLDSIADLSLSSDNMDREECVGVVTAP
jgi:hypothetical protein